MFNMDAGEIHNPSFLGQRGNSLIPRIMMTFQSHLLASIALTIIAALCIYHMFERSRTNAPGPFELPVFGAIPWLIKYAYPGSRRVLDGVMHLAQKYNFKTFTIKWIGEKRFIMTVDPANVEHVLKTKFSNYPKGPSFAGTLTDLLGHGIFVSDGEEWSAARKHASFMFSANNFRDTIVSTFHRHGRELEHVLESYCGHEPCDMFRLTNAFTLDSIGDIAFGANIGSLHSPDAPFARAFDEAQATLEARFFLPYWSLWRACGLIPGERRLKGCIHTMDSFCADLIASRRAAGDAHTRGDILSRYMCMTDEKSGNPLSDKAIRDCVLNVMIAGRDTTAQCVSWAMYRLCSHPDVEARVAAEAIALDDECRDTGQVGFCPTHEHLLSSLKYTRAVIQETLRLHPSVPKELKEALNDDVLPDGTRVPAGAFVSYLPYVMGRSETLWPDAQRWDPDRFMGPCARDNLNPFKFIAFNAGPRTCLGQPMAMLEASFLLSLMLRKYKFSLAPAPGERVVRVTYQDSLTLPVQGGLWVTVSRR